MLHVHSASFPEHGPYVGDVVLLNGHREDRRPLFRIRAAPAEGLAGRVRFQRSKMLMRPRVEQIGGDREIETASCPASLFGDAHPALRWTPRHGCEKHQFRDFDDAVLNLEAP
jgi:hypothetical protein